MEGNHDMKDQLKQEMYANYSRASGSVSCGDDKFLSKAGGERIGAGGAINMANLPSSMNGPDTLNNFAAVAFGISQQGGMNGGRVHPGLNDLNNMKRPMLSHLHQGMSSGDPQRKFAPDFSSQMLNGESAKGAPNGFSALGNHTMLPLPNGSKLPAAASMKSESPSLAKKADSSLPAGDDKKNLLNLKPKRPLSAYNFFFQEERSRLLGVPPCTEDEKKRRKHRKSHGKIAFTDLARYIGQKWKNLDAETKSIYERKQQEDRKRYQKELSLYDQMIKEIHGMVEVTEDNEGPQDKGSKSAGKSTLESEKKVQRNGLLMNADGALGQGNMSPYPGQMAQLLNMQKQQQQQLAQLQNNTYLPGSMASVGGAGSTDQAALMQQQRVMDTRGQYERALLAAMYDKMLRGPVPGGNAGLGMLPNMNGFLPQGDSSLDTSLLFNGMHNLGNLSSLSGGMPQNNQGSVPQGLARAAGLSDGANTNQFLSSLSNVNVLNDLAVASRQQERQVLALQQQLQGHGMGDGSNNPNGMQSGYSVPPSFARMMSDGGVSTSTSQLLSSLNGTMPSSVDDIAAMSRQRQERQQQVLALQQLQQAQYGGMVPDLSRGI